jgi:hypothetical protein
MRNVRELSHEELEELRFAYFYEVLDSSPDLLADVHFASEVPMELVLEHYEHISFVEEDFSCNIKD